MSTTTLKSKLDEVTERLDEKRKEAQEKHKAWEQAKEEFVQAGNDPSNTDSDEFKKVHEVSKEYGEACEEIERIEKGRDALIEMLAVDSGSPPGESKRDPDQADLPGRKENEQVKSFVQRLIESDGFKAVQEAAKKSRSVRIGEVELGELDLAEQKALITGGSDTSAGAFVVSDRKPYVPQPQRMLKVVDLITVGGTNSDTVEYPRQTTFTNVAAETAEAADTSTGTKPEATIAFEIVSAAVKTIAHWVPASRQALSDAAQLQTLIESQLRYGLDLRLEGQVVNGDGSGANLRGILNTSGILSQAKGADSTPDAIHKAITKIRLSDVEPNGVALHPNDWEVVRLQRDDSGAGAGTGGYLFGPPSTVGAETIWGLPVAVSASVPDDTGIVGDFRYATLWLREAAQVLVSDSHSDFFVKNLVAVLAELRAAFGVQIPAAFCKVTSID